MPMLCAAVPRTQPFTEGRAQGGHCFKLAIVLLRVDLQLQELHCHSLSSPAWHGGAENASIGGSAAELSTW